MSLFVQVLLGTLTLTVTTLPHIYVLIWLARSTRRTVETPPERPVASDFWALSRLFAGISLSHGFQVLLWCLPIAMLTDLRDAQTIFYFTLVTFSSLGYGDVVLSEWRIYAAMAAICGVISFGLSTALLVGFFTRIVPASS